GGAEAVLVPLSLAQQRMWFLNRFDDRTGVDNIPVVLRLTGALDVAALAGALEDVVARHETLRTVYPEMDGIGYQQVLPMAELAFDIVAEPVTTDLLPSWIAEVAGSYIDVTREIPFRFALFRVSDADDPGAGDPPVFVAVLVVHHISGDGFSMRPLLRDVVAAYGSRAAGEAPVWTPLPVQYADYAVWRREVLGSAEDPGSLVSRQLAYWVDRLRDVPEQIELPADRPRPEVASYSGGLQGFTVDAGLHEQLRELARARGVTLFMVVHAALAVWAARMSGSRDIAVGTPIAGRGDRGLDDLIGMFVNTLVLRTTVSPQWSFEELLAEVRAADVAAFAHADVPFEQLVDVVSPVRSQARHPLFQVALTFEAAGAVEAAGVTLPGLSVTPVEVPVATAKFDIQLTVGATADGGLGLSWNYATDLFDPETVTAFAQRLIRVLRAVAEDPRVVIGDIDLLTETERHDVTRRWVSSEPVALPAISFGDAVGPITPRSPGLDPAANLPDLFDATVAEFGDRLAVRFGDDRLSY
ncbi:condensation domain-containing protein, partial [Nocardia sp. alder85J]|uniref:condensation domain-containing protein n=1 Tax=Nocardia sp. alder85J TaxID=2862949 RepID=UPI00224D2BDD